MNKTSHSSLILLIWIFISNYYFITRILFFASISVYFFHLSRQAFFCFYLEYMNVSLCFYVHVSVTWLHVAFKFIHKKAETILLRYSRRWVTALQRSEMLTRGCSHGTPTKKYPLCYFVYGREKHKRCTVRVRRQASVSCRTHQGYCIITIFCENICFITRSCRSPVIRSYLLSICFHLLFFLLFFIVLFCLLYLFLFHFLPYIIWSFLHYFVSVH